MLGIIIPTFNRPHHLQALLEFFLGVSDNEKFELIILDNCSDFEVAELVSLYNDKMPIVLSISESNTGSMELNLARLSLLPEFNIYRYTHIWVLGDDDMPIENSFRFIFDCLSLNPAFLIFSNCFTGFSAVMPSASNIYEFNSISHYFMELINNSVYDSIAGLMFISNVILRQDVFRQIYMLPINDDSSVPPTNLTVFSGICRLDVGMQSIEGPILAIKLDLVKVAFRVKGGKSAVIQPAYMRLKNGEECLDLPYVRLRDWLDTWLAISPNIYRISMYDGYAALWFYRHLEYYASLIVPSLDPIPASYFNHWEYHLFSAYLRKLCEINDTKMLRTLVSITSEKKLYPVRFVYYSLGFNGFFSPMNGWNW